MQPKKLTKEEILEKSIITLYAFVAVIGYCVFVFHYNVSCIGLTILFGIQIAWFVNHQSFTLFYVLVGYISVLVVYHNVHASLGSNEYWPLRLWDSFDKRSSCTKLPHVQLAYNPNGLTYKTLEEINIAFTFCHYEETRWADDTGLAIKGTSRDLFGLPVYPGPCKSGCTIASTYKEDYIDNLGRGLSNGWSIEANPGDTRRCPGVRSFGKGNNNFGVGDYIPSTCSWTFYTAGLIKDNLDYYPYPYFHPLCVFCPGYSKFIDNGNQFSIRAVIFYYGTWLFMLAVWFVVTYKPPQKEKLDDDV